MNNMTLAPVHLSMYVFLRFRRPVRPMRNVKTGFHIPVNLLSRP